MLKHAVKGRVPLISVWMEDTVYAKDVLEDIAGVDLQEWKDKLDNNKVYYKVSRSDKGLHDPQQTYKVLAQAGSTLIYVNLTKPTPEFLHLGALSPSPGLLKKKMPPNLCKPEEVDAVVTALGGLSLKDAMCTIRVTKGRDGPLTASGCVNTRKNLLKESRGLTMVDTYLPAYMPDHKLAEFVASEKKWFMNGHDIRLRPRGILLDGPPGTGKTQGAKYVAREWGIPLFRLDSTFASKWVGESESNFSLALKTAESGSPCVLLVDEIEKFFSGSKGDNTGIMQRVMGNLLWWLQEHEAKVLTIMTTNDKSAIPPELYREGRLDHVFYFARLKNLKEIENLALISWKSYTGEESVPASLLDFIAQTPIPEGHDGISHTKVVSLVRDYVKAMEG
jgi:hypothetical protein